MPQAKASQIHHYPQLDTVLMMEEFIREHSCKYKNRSQWENLPRKIMYQTFKVVYDYFLNLEKSPEMLKIRFAEYGKPNWWEGIQKRIIVHAK